MSLFIESPAPTTILGAYFIAQIILPDPQATAQVMGSDLSKGSWCKEYDDGGHESGEASPVPFTEMIGYDPDQCVAGKKVDCWGAWCGISMNAGLWCVQGTEGTASYSFTTANGKTGTFTMGWTYLCLLSQSVTCTASSGWKCAASWRNGNIHEGLELMIGTFIITPQ